MPDTTAVPAESAMPIPPGWRWVRLGEVCEVNPCRPAGLVRSVEEPVSFIPMAAIDATTGTVSSPGVRPWREVCKGYTYLEEGDVLFAKITPCMENGKHAVARGLLSSIGFASTEFHVIRCAPSVLPEWVQSFLRLPSTTQEAARHFTGAVGQQRVPEGVLRSLVIPLPPLSEQRRIGAILAEQMAVVEQVRAAAAAQAEAARTLQAAYLHRAFRGIVPLSASTLPQAAPPGWAWHRLADLARLESGHTPSRFRPDWWGGAIPWLALPDIRALDGKVVHSTAESTNGEGIAHSSARVLPTGTVCLSRTASVGFVAVMGRPMATSQDFFNWVCGDAIASGFLMYLLMASRESFRGLASGAVHQTVYMPTARALRVCIPSIREQESIAADLDHCVEGSGELMQCATAQRVAVNALPAALLRRAFRGEL